MLKKVDSFEVNWHKDSFGHEYYTIGVSNKAACVTVDKDYADLICCFLNGHHGNEKRKLCQRCERRK